MILRFDIERDDLSPWTAGMRRKLASRENMNGAVAGKMFLRIAENFDVMTSTNHNPFGVPASFWALMKAGTRPGADASSGWVAMPRPVALRYFGGTVYPGAGKKMLTIPAREEAYGKSARDFSDLRLAVMGAGPSGGKTLALVQVDQQKVKYGRKRKDGSRSVTPGAVSGGGVFFWLVPSATIRGDDRVLPKQEELLRAGVSGLRSYLAHQAHEGLTS